MAVRLIKDGKVLTTLGEDQAFNAMLPDFQKYKDYYQSHGFQVEQVGPISTTQSPELKRLADFHAGRKVEGAVKGYAAPTAAYDKGGALTSALQKPTANASSTGGQPNFDGDTIRVLMPDQSTRFFSIQDEALDAALQNGARPVEIDGAIMTDLKQFNGGWVVRRGDGYIPLNVLAGGDWMEGQQEALAAGGLGTGVGNNEYQGTEGQNNGGSSGGWNGGGGGQGPIPTGGGTGSGGGTPTGGGYQNNGWMGNQNANAPALSKDLEDALRELMQEARTQGVRGQEALTGLVDDYKNYLGFARSAAEQTFAKRDELTERLAGVNSPVLRGIDSAMQTMNQSTGLSPEAMQALRLNAIEGPERAYQGQVEALKTQLGQRGAYGGGALPGDAGALVRGYAPLMQGRDAQRSNLLANTILADEQRKFDTLGLNRQTALGAMNTGAGLAGSLASAYNPSSLFGANEAALSGLGNTLASRTNAGFQGLNTAAGIGGTLSDNQPTSFKNLLLASLLGTGGNILSDPNNWSKIGDFFGGLFGGGSGTPTQTAGNNLPIPTNPFPTNPAPTTPTTPPYNSGY